jgi:4-alpha-glucanotransferase
MGVPGYKVLRWEKVEPGKPEEGFLPPAQYPELSIATTGTHDTESLTVYWRDADESERAKLIRALALDGVIRRSRTRLDEGQLCAVIEALYASPSVLVVMPIQDLFGWSARINVPGTVRDGNWTYRLPLTIERMKASPPILWRAARLRAIARRTGRA